MDVLLLIFPFLILLRGHRDSVWIAFGFCLKIGCICMI